MNEGNKRIARGDKNPLENSDIFKIVEVAEVVSVIDPNGLGRIKARIKGPRSTGGDDGILDNDLPWAFPLIPKYFSSQPKVKEAVYIFIFGKNREHADRIFVGPIISQPQQLNLDPFYMTALRGFSFGSQNPDVSIDRIPELKGVFPDPNDISIQGRYNTDITQKTNEVVIRAGKFVNSITTANNPFTFKFNTQTQSFLQLKNDVILVKKTDDQEAQNGSVANLVANKINLLTHKDGSPIFNLTNQESLISDDELLKILDEAHQLPFGDILLQYLRLLKDALFAHVHNGSGNPPTDLTSSGNKQSLAIFKAKADDLEKSMLSKNIRIN